MPPAQDLGNDLGLVAYKSQYEAELHMLVATGAYAARNPDLLGLLKEHATAARQCLIGLVDKKRLHLSPVARKATARSGAKLIQEGQPGAIGECILLSPTERLHHSPEPPLPAIDDRLSLCNRLGEPKVPSTSGTDIHTVILYRQIHRPTQHAESRSRPDRIP